MWAFWGKSDRERVSTSTSSFFSRPFFLSVFLRLIYFSCVARNALEAHAAGVIFRNDSKVRNVGAFIDASTNRSKGILFKSVPKQPRIWILSPRTDTEAADSPLSCKYSHRSKWTFQKRNFTTYYEIYSNLEPSSVDLKRPKPKVTKYLAIRVYLM